MIIRMMYVLPMILGRTYDVAKNTIGVDIFAPQVIQNPRVFENRFFTSNFKTVESSADVKDILEINGDLSLNLKMGVLHVDGLGSYIKSNMRSQNSVDILAKVSFRTVTHSLPHGARPISGWSDMDRQHLGTHFVQSVVYGGDLFAFIRFKAARAEDLEEIRAMVKASLSGGSALDLVGNGKLESLNKELQKKATMEINYFATVPIEGVPNTMEGLRNLVQQFEQHVKKVNGGLGVPVEVELNDFSSFGRKEFLKNSVLETELGFFEECLDDLLRTKARLSSFLLEYSDKSFSKNDEKEMSQLTTRIRRILKEFYTTVANLDLQEGFAQLDSAKNAYTAGIGHAIPGKFQRELNRILKKIDKNIDDVKTYYSVYTHYGSSGCASEATMLHVGYAASSPRHLIGAGHNYMCLPKTPDLDSSDETVTSKKASSVAGVKYGLLKSAPLSVNEKAVALKGVVCAECLVEKQSAVTFFGQKECPVDGGWSLQYRGFLMTGSDIERSESVCVDSRLEYHNDSYMGEHDQSLDFVLTSHAESPGLIPCVICVK